MDDEDFVFKASASKPSLLAPKRPAKKNETSQPAASSIFSEPLFKTKKETVEKDESFGLPRISPNKPSVECPLCKKSLNHLNEIRRSLHINTCLDKDESHDSFAKATERHSKTVDCPVCGEPQAPGPHRNAHIKRCGRESNLSGNILMKMMDTQTKAVEIKKSKNIPHTKAPAPVMKDVKAPKLHGEPKTGMDEQMQLAKAMSASLAPPTVHDVKEKSPQFTRVPDPNENRRKRPRSYAIVELAPRSCQCQVLSSIQTRFLDVFRVKGKGNLTTANQEASRKTDSFSLYQRRLLDKLARLESLSEDLGRLQNSPKTHDVIINCNNGQLPVHEFILRSRTPKLTVTDGSLRIEEDVEIVQHWLNYVYTSKTSWSIDDNTKILSLAQQHGPECLLPVCRRFESRSPEDLDIEPKEGSIKLEVEDADMADIEKEESQISMKQASSSPSQQNDPELIHLSSLTETTTRRKTTSPVRSSSTILRRGERMHEPVLSTSEAGGIDCEDPLQGLNMTASTDEEVVLASDDDECIVLDDDVENVLDDPLSPLADTEADKEDGGDSIILCSSEKDRSPDLFDDYEHTTNCARIPDENPSWVMSPLNLDGLSASECDKSKNQTASEDQREVVSGHEPTPHRDVWSPNNYDNYDVFQGMDYPDGDPFDEPVAEHFWPPDLADHNGALTSPEEQARVETPTKPSSSLPADGDPIKRRSPRIYDDDIRICTPPPNANFIDSFDKTMPQHAAPVAIPFDSFDVTMPHRRMSIPAPPSPSSFAPPLAQSTPAQATRSKATFASNVKILKTVGITPMPNFEVMGDEDLKRELANHGMRPMGRKRAVDMLQNIYEATHPVIDPNTPTARPFIKRPVNADEPCTSKEPPKKKSNAKAPARKALTSALNKAVVPKPSTSAVVASKPAELLVDGQDSCEDDNEGLGDRTLNDSLDEPPEDSMLEDDGPGGTIPKDLTGMTTSLLTWLRLPENVELYNHMLTLQPVMLDELHVRVSRADDVVCTISKKALATILEKLGVTFSLPQQGRGGGGAARRKK